jgi:large subunit ribosomal protein L10
MFVAPEVSVYGTRLIFLHLKMAVNKAKKQEVLAVLEEKFGKAKAVYFADFRGLTVKQVGELRKKLRDEGVEYYVAKKTLMKLSVKNVKLPEIPDELMTGPVAAAFSYDDVISPARILHSYAKAAEKLDILGGFVDGKYVSKSEAVALATLPSREELLAKLVGSMKSPISGFHSVLSGVMRGFVYALKGVADKKGNA